jgi:hypothetical protein
LVEEGPDSRQELGIFHATLPQNSLLWYGENFLAIRCEDDQLPTFKTARCPDSGSAAGVVDAQSTSAGNVCSDAHSYRS